MASQPEYRINLRPYRILFWPLLLPIALLLALFNKVSPVPLKVYSIRVERVGHLIANQEEFMMQNDLGLLPREFRVMVHKDYPSNGVLLQMLKRLLPINNLFLPLYDLCQKMGGMGVSSMELHRYPGSDSMQLASQTDKHLEFTEEEIQEARRQCQQLGINPDKSFIPVLGRDSAYLSSIKEATDIDSYRNVDIDSYVPALEYLAQKHQVVRMGSVVKEALNTAHPNILDYSQSGRRSELLDVYLPAKCRFFLTCGSGIDAITWSCRLPILFVQYIPPLYAPNFKSGCMFIFKKYWHTVEERYLTLSELLNSDAGSVFTPRELAPMNIVVHDNTPEEILEVTQEMEARLDGTWAETEEDIELQERFWSHYKKLSDEYVICSRIGAAYLRNNRFWLE